MRKRNTLGKDPVKNVAVIGNYLPRQCGIATFTTHLCDALADAYPDTNVFAVAVNDTEVGYRYPEHHGVPDTRCPALPVVDDAGGSSACSPPRTSGR